LRESIIQTSLELGSELGEDGLTMRGIAARLGVSATALYQHFESKQAILHEIRVWGLQQLAAALEPAQELADSADRLTRMAVLYVEFARQNPWLYEVLMEQEQLPWNELPRDEVDRLLAPLATVRGHVQSAVDSGAFRAELDVNAAAMGLWASVHGLASLMIAGRISAHHPVMPVSDEAAFVRGFVRNMLLGFNA
jgi:AcrR family transcriptional regulator